MLAQLLIFLTWLIQAILFLKTEPLSYQKKLTIVVLFFTCFLWLYQPILTEQIIFIGSLLITIFYDFIEMMIPDFCSVGLITTIFLSLILNHYPTQLFFEMIIFGLLINLFDYLHFKVKGYSAIGDGDKIFIPAVIGFIGISRITNIIFIYAALVGFLYCVFTRKDKAPFGGIFSLVVLSRTIYSALN